MVHEPSYKSIYFYRQDGVGTEPSAIYPANESPSAKRISKGKDDTAVIKKSLMQFKVEPIKIKGDAKW